MSNYSYAKTLEIVWEYDVAVVGGGQAEGHSKMAQPYDIPYRCLLPLGVENLLTSGRCISGTHRAHASYRVMAICMATGKAAGVASAIAAKSDRNLREIGASEIQKVLRIEALSCSIERCRR